MLRRELGALRDILDVRITAVEETARQFRADITRIPTDTDKQVGQLRELHEGKFEGLQMQLQEREKRRKELDMAAKDAIAAALLSQKEAFAAQNSANAAAITKSDVATEKQLDNLRTLMTTTTSALADKIEAINKSLNRGEGVTISRSQSIATTIAVAVAAASVVMAVSAVVSIHPQTPSQISVSPPASVTTPSHP